MPHIVPEERVRATQIRRKVSRLDSMPANSLVNLTGGNHRQDRGVGKEGVVWTFSTSHSHNEHVSETMRPVASVPLSVCFQPDS